MLKFITLIIIGFLLSFLNAFGQETIPVAKAVILSVEDDKVYLDLGEGSINVGDRLQVIRDRGFFTHPVTGEQIARDPEIVAYIQITDVRSNYSEGMVSPRNAMSMLEVGMEAFLLEGEDRDTHEFRRSIAVQPLNVSSAIGGYLGIYIADLLTEEIFNIDQFRVIDRQSLGWQMDEIALATQGVVDEKEAIRVGRTRGVDYFITGTMYEPDVVDLSTGVPLKGIVGAAEAISGVRLGAEYVSDVRVSQLRAIVNITLRVVDVETGEILFITSEMQQATGRSEVNLEQGVLGGMQIQGGTTSFLNTITGQATKAALTNLADYINGYFDGTIDVRNFRGNVIEIGRVGARSESRSERREQRNASIIHAEKTGEDDNFGRETYNINIDRGSETGFRRNFLYSVYETTFEESRISGEIVETGRERIGKVKLNYVEGNASQGVLSLIKGINQPYDYSFHNSIVVFDRNPKIGIETTIFFYSYDDTYNSQIYGLNNSIDYRITDYFGIGLKFILGKSWYLGPMGTGYYEVNRFLSLYGSGGFVFRVEEVDVISPSIGVVIEGGTRFYAARWLSVNIKTMYMPYYGIRLGGGIGFHIF